ncbi:PREDICTED: synaptonemal complex central element protein 2 [Nestor notabilis]|uniref:synaptonemal complex central element protein 2 n=1 Tax=Nestor notabilis TaxID=176057 RepID=UPI000523B296|nr:PREDICTED: synaptonemal complex central element protein 2 [Nestor notabilis]
MEPVPGAEAALDAPSSRYFASLDASVGDLQQRAQHLIDTVNSSRKEDHNVMSTELQQVCRTVEAAYRDLCLQPET